MSPTAKKPATAKTAARDDSRIREFAYQIWESEGRPDNQHARHWEMAEKLAAAEAAGQPVKAPAPRKPAAKKAAAPMEPAAAVKKPRPSKTASSTTPASSPKAAAKPAKPKA
ncbi:MAG: DUF2934 domain-containing protein [Gammaproteobacteria bacterium]|nr:DUF2934 domain-containing protein [Gammaproteobacteria bacterium]MBU1489552.1 DUF2934 domain-containing protein [Gammaproteobacteria bacterium]MBU2067829.1 DUF2934 domain-containing protein [Gammaproteobacteria bacterium]MBU2141012.1 DUF2934 domain-containing protein [Gammaproteobacteria bacterium]MBU2217357.1 DUF2934 domain-containing protein [Gammaproteobacteria bacterium]